MAAAALVDGRIFHSLRRQTENDARIFAGIHVGFRLPGARGY